MTRIERTMLLTLALALFPVTSRADVGSLGGLAMFALEVGAVLWGVLTLLFFLLMRRRLTLGKRIACTVLFCFAPVLYVALLLLKSYAFGEFERDVTETTRKPVVVSGATFPPGSQAHYTETGGFLGLGADRTLLDIRSPKPVLLGSIRIDSMKVDSGGDELTVDLSVEQTIDGWLCAGGEYTVVYAEPTGISLYSCWLSQPREWRGKTVPAGTFVSRNGNTGDWLLAEAQEMPRPDQN
ncbi:hypothetical protein LFL96_28130 [Paraburkholderia sp. D15]|uniref:hypothetical protein n=1 Tax=Paraburkholderia sp. D15 TaxID=2880218 RepID=UPI0024797B06|nr:hypothetical protein [Paraburkholderia sp. D15]WGS52075.1 hypothetical protein LFL96_28130 [Paraburkholderia sp. D15]